MARAKEKIRHLVFEPLWTRLGNVIVPVGIGHSVVQITVQRPVFQPVVRVTVNKELRPISPHLHRSVLCRVFLAARCWHVTILSFYSIYVPDHSLGL